MVPPSIRARLAEGTRSERIASARSAWRATPPGGVIRNPCSRSGGPEDAGGPAQAASGTAPASHRARNKRLVAMGFGPPQLRGSGQQVRGRLRKLNHKELVRQCLTNSVPPAPGWL